nr:MAG TPA: hypothetical protein [Crassvirales sp.]
MDGYFQRESSWWNLPDAASEGYKLNGEASCLVQR